MSLLLDSDEQATLQSIGEDTIQAIVALCVESILWSESIRPLLLIGNFAHACAATYLVLVIIAARILLYVS